MIRLMWMFIIVLMKMKKRVIFSYLSVEEMMINNFRCYDRLVKRFLDF